MINDDEIEIDYENLMEMLSVSGGDVLSVSGNESTSTNIYVLTLPQEETEEVVMEESYSLFDKPLQDYTVSEGLLLLITVLAFIVVIYHIVKGGLSWLGW